MENPDRPGDQPRPKTPKPTTEPTHNKHKRPHASTGGFRLRRTTICVWVYLAGFAPIFVDAAK